MYLSEVMVLLDSSLKKCESCSFRKLIRNRDKAVKQSECLFEVAEELSDCSFAAVIESEIGDLSCQGYDVMLCNILFCMVMVQFQNDGPGIPFKFFD